MYNPHLNFYYSAKHPHAQTVEVDTHDCYELVYFIHANATLAIGSKQYQLKSGDFYIVYPHTPHSEVHIESRTVLVLGFDTNDFPRDVLQETLYRIKNHDKIRHIIELIVSEAIRQELNYNEMIAHHLGELFLLIERYTTNTSFTAKSFDFAFNYIREHYTQDISFEQLASISGYSPDHFRHIFSQTYKISPKQFQINLRLNKAAELLQSGLTNCTDIAELCGFSNSAQFSKMFKKHFHVTPKQFQQQNK